jgi:hypothetical protein
MTLVALGAALLAAPALAQEESTAPTPRLFPDTLNLELVDGSAVPNDCMYPASIQDAARFDIACVTMPRLVSGEIGARYIGQLGAMGWRQGDYVTGGMTAVRIDENNCQHVLNLFPGDYPPGDENSAIVVLWFALERAPRCAEGGAQ